MFVQIDPKVVVIDKTFMGMCKLPFYGHPRGCPNYGKKEGCPPSKFVESDIFDFNQDLFVIYTPFNVGIFAERMKQTHLEWAKFPRQWYNPRRWQPSARALHRDDLDEFHKATDLSYYEDNSPEARGVNVSSLMNSIGIPLNWQWPPAHVSENKAYEKNLVYVVSLAGHLR